jgi:hypothetical protein
MEICQVRSDFCDILQKQRNSILIRFASGRLDRASGQSSLKYFPRSNRNLEFIWTTGYHPDVLPSLPDVLKILNIVRTCCRVIRTDYRDFPNSVDFWKQTPCWILIDRASGRCCSDVRTSSMFICKTLRGVRMSSKACPNSCTGTG